MMQVWTQWQGEVLATASSPGDFEEQLASGGLAELVPREGPDDADNDPNLIESPWHELRKKHS